MVFRRGTADQVEKGIAGSGKSRGLGNRGPVGKKESRAQATGSDVVWKGKPRTS